MSDMSERKKDISNPMVSDQIKEQSLEKQQYIDLVDYLMHGLKLTGVRRIYRFTQKLWMKERQKDQEP